MLKGKVKRVLWESDNGKKIALFSILEADEKIPNDNDTITILGYFPSSSKLTLVVEGEWVKYKGNYQYKVTMFDEEVPVTEDGIIAYLSSGLIKGVGEKTAKKIVKQFGTDTLNVFNNTPEQLLSVRGITRKKLDKIITSYQESKSIQEIVRLLTPYGVSTNKCVKISKEFGDKAVHIITDEPFKLCEIDGFGFKTVDAIARRTSVNFNDELRIKGAIKYILTEAELQGHLCLPQKDVLILSHALLNEGFDEEVVAKEEIVKVFCDMATEQVLMGDNKMAYLGQNYKEEKNIAEDLTFRLRKSMKKTVFTDSQIDEEILICEKENGIKLADSQKKAVRMACKNPVCIITGGAGTGKTTVLKFILQILIKLMEIKDVSLLAPTGRAASRMSESIGRGFCASTIHSALQLKGDYCERSIDTDILIVDEMSMVDNKVFSILCSAVSYNTRIILVGDDGQLPSVGAGNVLYELLKSKIIPSTKLEVIFRQKGTSPIVENSTFIRNGITELKYCDEFQLTTKDTASAVAEEIKDIFLKCVEEKGIDEVQVLCPFRKNGEASANSLNAMLQDIYNPRKAGKAEIKRGSTCFREGDKVMQIKNNYEIYWEREDGSCGMGIYNGDVGYITKIQDGDTVVIRFDDKFAELDVAELLDIELAYATTIHKSQGSEYKTVIMPMLTSFYIMLKRNLIYTGVTRAKEKIIIIGQSKALSMAINKNDIAKRYTQLADRLIELNNK